MRYCANEMLFWNISPLSRYSNCTIYLSKLHLFKRLMQNYLYFSNYYISKKLIDIKTFCWKNLRK